MKRHFLLFTLFLSFGFGFAQTKDSLSVEEQERRKRNIEAGNPFKEFGYTPKIATLSKGKYLEWHDLDSIVRIGSYSYHVKRKEITGYNMHEDKISESTLLPELTSRWMSPDPLAEEFPSWTPYHYVHNNPINMIDPTGLAAEWVPTVKEDGTTAYKAETGDSASSLASQYGLGQETAESITGTTGDDVISEGTEVSGDKVKEVTGSDILKLDLNSKMATSQRKFDQFIFAADHSKSQGENGFYTTQYYGNVHSQYNRMMSGFANLQTDNGNINVHYDIPLYETQGVFFNVTQYPYYLNNSFSTDKNTYGSRFGNYGDIYNLDFQLYLSFDKGNSLKAQGKYRLSTPIKNQRELNKKFKN